MGFKCRRRLVLRPKFKKPLKGYKKLVSDVFPKFHDPQLRNRKLVKLCEYASRNPLGIPEITRLVEKRLFNEMYYGCVHFGSVVMDTYLKLLSMCERRTTEYFAPSLLYMIQWLMDPCIRVYVQIHACQTLTKFIHSQTDKTYAWNIDIFVGKVCMLARVSRGLETSCRQSLPPLADRAYASYINACVKREPKLAHRNKKLELRSLRASCLQCLAAMVWYMDAFFRVSDGIGEVANVMLDNYVDNTDNKEGEGGTGVADLEKLDISNLTREEILDPRTWAQICLQNMAELGKERTTMRQILCPMLEYFDTEHQWSPQQGLAIKVLCDMALFSEDAGKQLLILEGVVQHMDHKNVTHDLAVKSCVAKAAADLACQIRFGPSLSDVGWVSDLLRHLGKCLQVTTREGDTDAIQLESSIMSCLIELAKGIDNPWPLFYVMIMSLEDVPRDGVVAQATMGSVLVLAHILVAFHSHSQQAFPEALFQQLLKAMVHRDTEARILGHHILSVLLFPSCVTRGWESWNVGVDVLPLNLKNSVIHRAYSFIGRIAVANSSPKEPCTMKLSEDQILLLLCSFRIQFNYSDNLPSNFVAIARSYCLTLMSSDIKSSSESLVRIFQLPLSLRNTSLSVCCGKTSLACRRSIVVTSIAMLMFAASRLYPMDNLNDLLSLKALSIMDPCLGINEELGVYVRPNADIRRYDSAADNQVAGYYLSKLSGMEDKIEKAVLEIIVPHLSRTVKMEQKELLGRLSAPFSVDHMFVYASKDVQDLHLKVRGHYKNCSANSVTRASSAPKVSFSPPKSRIISTDELLERVHAMASERAGTSNPSSPNSSSYTAMARSCEALILRRRADSSNVFVDDNSPVRNATHPVQGHTVADEVAAQLEQSEPTTSPSLRAMAAEAEAYRSRSRARLLNTLSSKGRGRGESSRVDHEVKVPTLPPFHKYEFSDEKLQKFELMDDLLQIVREQQRQQEQQEQQQQ